MFQALKYPCMYICLCNNVTDTDIRAAVDGGVHNLRQLKAATGCSTGCGKCVESAQQELVEALWDRRQFLRIVPSPSAA